MDEALVQLEQIGSSQPSKPFTGRIKHRLEANWIYMSTANGNQCYELLKRAACKMTASQNNINRRCNIHPNKIVKPNIKFYHFITLL